MLTEPTGSGDMCSNKHSGISPDPRDSGSIATCGRHAGPLEMAEGRICFHGLSDFIFIYCCMVRIYPFCLIRKFGSPK